MGIFCPSHSLYHENDIHNDRLLTTTPNSTFNPNEDFLYDSDSGIVSMRTSSVSSSFSNNNNSDSYLPIFRTVVGLEIHAQLTTPTKLFSSAPTRYYNSFHPNTDSNAGLLNEEYVHSISPNIHVHPHDLAYPGTLPLLSTIAIRTALLTSASLNCKIATRSRFERKHYWYGDLPKGYQVTQMRWPLAKDGYLLCRRNRNTDKSTNMKNAKNKDKRGRREKSRNEQEDNNNEDEMRERCASTFFRTNIERIQLEQDTGRTKIHTHTNQKSSLSLFDFNRSGSALVEVVFRPDIRSSKDAMTVVSTLRDLLRYVGTCDGKMEDGSLRCDLNVSIASIDSNYDSDIDHINNDKGNPFQKYLPPNTGKRVEVKNLNSVKQIGMAVEYEVLRQVRKVVLEKKRVIKATRMWDGKGKKTVRSREKGGEREYRFMREPDLRDLVLDKEVLEGKTLGEFLSDHLPALPEEEISRLITQYGLSEKMALIISSDRSVICMFENTVEVARQRLLNRTKQTNQSKISKGFDLDFWGMHDDVVINVKDQRASMSTSLDYVAVAVANWLCNDLFALVKESSDRRNEWNDVDESGLNHPISMQYSNVTATRLGELLALVLSEMISTTQGKRILKIMFEEDLKLSPAEIMELRGWRMIKDPIELRDLCRCIVMNPSNSKQLDLYRKSGKHVKKITKYFAGKVMMASDGNAHPERMNIALESVLKEIVHGHE